MLNKLRAGIIGGLLGLTLVALNARTIAAQDLSTAVVDSGNVLLNYLNSSQANYLQGFAHGRIWAIYLTANPSVVCNPPDAVITRGQVYDVVKNYLVAHPETRHELGEILILRAFANAWPCKGRR